MRDLLRRESAPTEFSLHRQTSTTAVIFPIALVSSESPLDSRETGDHRIEENANDDFLNHTDSVEHLQRRTIGRGTDRVDSEDKKK